MLMLSAVSVFILTQWPFQGYPMLQVERGTSNVLLQRRMILEGYELVALGSMAQCHQEKSSSV